MLVAPGTYSENINFVAKAITVTSESGPQDTIIVGGNGVAVSFQSKEGRDSILNGFTLQNSVVGIASQQASPTITNNVIRYNRVCAPIGAGIWIISGSPLIRQNIITGNGFTNSSCDVNGAGINIQASSAGILDNVIFDNHATLGGGIYLDMMMESDRIPIIKGNVIKGNSASGGNGGGIYMVNSPNALIVQNQITGNQASSGGGIYFVPTGAAGGQLLVNNTIVANNAATGGSGIHAGGFDARTELTNNIIVAKPGQIGLYCGASHSNPSLIRFNNIFSVLGSAYGGSCSPMIGMNGNISADPLFIDQFQDNYHLLKDSPSIDSGYNQAPNLPDLDLDGDPRIVDGDGDGNAIIDMGAYEFPGPDMSPPTSTITFPAAEAIVPVGATTNITGVASDAGGTVARVEVSVDGGATWSVAIGMSSWFYPWTPTALGPATIKSRAVDNSGNVQNPPTEIMVMVQTRPTSIITFPVGASTTVNTGTTVNIAGLASDGVGGSSIDRVEVSVDGGATWDEATGTINWHYPWIPTIVGTASIKSRAIDTSGNIQDPPAQLTVEVRNPITFRVTPGQTIGSAIVAAIDGDTVLVAPGTYVENINFLGKAITVTSENGPDVTTIDGGGSDSVVIFTSREGRDSVINGFTLQNGNPGFGGGGVRIANASPTVTNNVITNNRGCAGAGIYVISGSPLIQLNIIVGNDGVRCGAGGGGILVYGIPVEGPSSPEILDNVISNNHSLGDGGGIFLNGAGTPTIKGNIIKGNTAQGGQGGGIYMVNQSDALIVQNLITNNQAIIDGNPDFGGRGGGLYWYVPSAASGPLLVNNTIVDNDAASGGSGIYADGFNAQTELTNNIIVAKPGQAGIHCGDAVSQSQPILRFNNIFGAASGMPYGGSCSPMTGMNGNISADPLFANQTQGDYHLQSGSPSINSGDNQASNLPDKDLDGALRILIGDGDGNPIVDMGVDEFTGQERSLPTSTIMAPAEGETVLTGTTVNITGIASAAVGRTVVMVEVSVDGGSTWNVATGTTAWSYNWTPALAGPTTIRSRAIDNGGNLQDPPAQLEVIVQDATPPTSTRPQPRE